MSSLKVATAGRDMEKNLPWLAAIEKVAWAIFLLALPVTSFPFFPPAVGGGALVRPLSLYPLLVLILIVILPRMLRGTLPRAILSLLPFVLVAIGVSLLSLTRGIEPALGVSVEDRILRGLITLAIGCGFYLAVALTPRSWDDLRGTLRWIYAGFGLALLWGSLQAIYVVYFTPFWYKAMDTLQNFVSIRRLMHNRVSGMTYEPNWFAEQISFLLLPWLLASVLANHSLFQWRWRRVTVETLLLGWAVLVLPFTFSRAGIMNLVAMVLASLLFLRFPSDKPAAQSTTRKVTRRLIEAGLVVVILGGLVFAAGTKNEFFARLWGYWRKNNATLSGYFEYLGFGARFTYGEAAFNTYLAYPWFGVGVGNYAFYFEEMLPQQPLSYTPEVLRLITPDVGRNRLITAKNFYFRLLAETGLVGTITFAAFLVAIIGCALYLRLSPNREAKFWGTGGVLGLIAFGLGALSFDSFAIPNMWVVFGIITAAAWVETRRSMDHRAVVEKSEVVTH